MRKFIVMVAAFIFFASFNATAARANETSEWLDGSNFNKGIVSVIYKSDVAFKLKVEKGSTLYTYRLKSNKKESFTLQSGSGKYTFSIIDEQDKTKVFAQKVVTVNIDNNRIVYLNSVQNIKWNKNDTAILKATQLTKSQHDDIGKAKAIYNYIVNNMSYASKETKTGYLPDINDMITTKKGICYDFASLYAAMLRSVNIPAKLVMGFADDVSVYHSWNEVYLNGNWVIVDTSVDSQLEELNMKFEFKKSASKYNGIRFF
ncbi:Transglutaminase-like superfamily protein [compost metagenome]